MTADQLITYLNAIHVGEVAAIRAKLAEAREACRALEQADLADRLDEAEQALVRADMRTYRRRVESVISRLGHLR